MLQIGYSLVKRVRGNKLVRISGNLLPAIDKAIQEDRDEFDIPRFSGRRELLDEAVKQFLRSLEKGKKE